MNVLGGILLILVGVVMIVFHENIRQARDEWWTGEYTRGGLLFVRGGIILVGAALVYAGLGIILKGG